jgi:glycosyltransferase involved in cell wall biosynthesis
VAIELETLKAQTPFDLFDFPEWACESYFHLVNRNDYNYVPIAIQLHGPLVMLAKTIGWPELDSELYQLGRSMEQSCLRLADLVYSSSACSADWCVREYGLDRESIPIWHTGVDTELFRPAEAPKSSRPTIIFVGKIERNKGINSLVEAAIKLASGIPELKLRMFGRGNADLISEITAKALAAGLPELLDLPGQVTQTDLPVELSKAHVFAAPSLYEGGPGFVYLEAMACGLPVVACKGSGSSEIIEHGETGILIPANDEAALTEALTRLLARPDEASAMGKRGREYVENQASSKDCIRRLESIYLTVVRDKVKHAQMSA